MRFLRSLLGIGAALLPLTAAQSSTSSAQNSTFTPLANNTANSTQRTITTTITSLIPRPSGASGSGSATSLLTLTLTLNTTDSTLSNNATLNGTASDNSTLSNATEPWKEGDDWLPFHIRLDPAYGVLGAFFILTGLPVAGLGGKNRWSSLAVVSGYCFMLFTLVMILRFGVEPNLQPPSPNPPSQTLRGLYLLACIIASFIGAGLGIFIYKFARYFVNAAGGFTFAWYLLETKSGGLVSSVLGRWGMLGGLTVGAFIAGIVPQLTDHMLLVSTAWIGATTFVLGIDCYTRAGLKEFYIYNLGFHDLFPKLEGKKYPLTQTMMIELGILAAVVLVGSAIQARVLNRLQKRLRHAREEEEMKLEAEEVAKAAERFKNVGTELDEWEEKHGNGSANKRAGSTLSGNASTAQLPILGSEDRSRTHSLSLGQTDIESRGAYEGVGMASPPGGASVTGTPTTGWFSIEELKDDSSPRARSEVASPAMTDNELEGKLKLLEEVKKARESIRGSIDELRRATPTPSLAGRLDAGSRPITPALSLRSDGHGGDTASRMSIGSRLLDDPESARNRRISTTSSRILDGDFGRNRQPSVASSRLLDITRSPVESPQASPTEWDKYMSDRKILAPPAAVSTGSVANRQSQYTMTTGTFDRREKTTSMIDLPSMSPEVIHRPAGLEDRRSRTISMLDPRLPPIAAGSPTTTQFGTLPASSSRRDPPTMYDPPSTSFPAPGQIVGSASTRHSQNLQARNSVTRTMTYDELADRHRKRLSKLQEPVSSKMREEEDIRIAKQKWERQKSQERSDMARRERDKSGRDPESERRVRQEEKLEVLKTTEDWRRSIHGGLDGYGRDFGPAESSAARPRESGGGGRGSERDRRASRGFAS